MLYLLQNSTFMFIFALKIKYNGKKPTHRIA